VREGKIALSSAVRGLLPKERNGNGKAG
jgi:hypothetical protein